jgi:hypothetical protein
VNCSRTCAAGHGGRSGRSGSGGRGPRPTAPTCARRSDHRQPGSWTRPRLLATYSWGSQPCRCEHGLSALYAALKGRSDLRKRRLKAVSPSALGIWPNGREPPAITVGRGGGLPSFRGLPLRQLHATGAHARPGLRLAVSVLALSLGGSLGGLAVGLSVRVTVEVDRGLDVPVLGAATDGQSLQPAQSRDAGRAGTQRRVSPSCPPAARSPLRPQSSATSRAPA